MSRKQHPEDLSSFYDSAAPMRDTWIKRNQAFYDDDLAYMRFLIPEGLRVLELGCGTGNLLGNLKPAYGVGIDFSAKMIERAREKWPDCTFIVSNIENRAACGSAGPVYESVEKPFDAIILSDLLGNLSDIQATLMSIRGLCTDNTRIVIAYYSPLWEPVLRFGESVGLRMPQPELTWLSSSDVSSFLALAGFETIKQEWRQLMPRRLLGLGRPINRFIAPFPGIRALCLRHYVIARLQAGRRQVDQQSASLSASVLIPCRNERGNVEQAVRRLPAFCDDLEIIYVEGGSSDGTFEECERVQKAFPEIDIKVFRQSGHGKGDAVRKGFAEARGDVLIILDADLTVPPEQIPKFYEVIASGAGEFVNGTRFVYPMESGAMRFLNYWANRTFSTIFSWLLNQRFTDTLCGTKVIRKKHYDQIVANHGYFGEFDPFGDFDLIFGASKLNLKIIEVPVRYAERTYGETQISRFRHGVLLLKMVVFAFRKLKAF